MSIEIIHGDVLSAKADALILTIDGSRKGLEGNLARAFARRWPDAFMDVEDQIRYPVPLGRTVATYPENECGFPLILVASTLHHVDVLSDAQKLGVIRAATFDALVLAQHHRVSRLAATVMAGGWRLELESAISCMLEVLKSLASAESRTTVALHFNSGQDADLAVKAARRHHVETSGCRDIV
jgi:O-acetyl-ADP-ribose deacetylase (regulator of RNase III)